MNATPTTSVSVLTIDTAPLDIEALGKIGRFQMRRLAEALCAKGIEICDTDGKKQAFMQLKLPEMAAELFTALKAYREASGQPVPKTPVKAPKTPVVKAAVEEAAPVQEKAIEDKVAITEELEVKLVPGKTPVAREGDIVKVNIPGAEEVSKISNNQAAQARAFEEWKTQSLATNRALVSALATMAEQFSAQSAQLARLEKLLYISIGATAAVGDNLGSMTVAAVIEGGVENSEELPFLLRKAFRKDEEDPIFKGGDLNDE